MSATDKLQDHVRQRFRQLAWCSPPFRRNQELGGLQTPVVYRWVNPSVIWSLQSVFGSHCLNLNFDMHSIHQVRRSEPRLVILSASDRSLWSINPGRQCAPFRNTRVLTVRCAFSIFHELVNRPSLILSRPFTFIAFSWTSAKCFRAIYENKRESFFFLF